MKVWSGIFASVVIFSMFGCGGVSEPEVLKTEIDREGDSKLNSENFIDIARLYYIKDLNSSKKVTNRSFSETRPLYPGGPRESVKQKDVFYIKSQGEKLTIAYNNQTVDVEVDLDLVKIVYDDGFKIVSEQMKLSDFVGTYSSQVAVGE